MKKFRINMTFWLTLGVKPSEVIETDGNSVASELEDQFLNPDPYFDSSNFSQFGIAETKFEYSCIKLDGDDNLYSRQLDIQITGSIEDTDGFLNHLVDADILEDASNLNTFAPREFWFNCLEDCDIVFHPKTDDNLTDNASRNEVDGTLEFIAD